MSMYAYKVVYSTQLLLTIVLLSVDLSFFKNTVDPDQLASVEAI